MAEGALDLEEGEEGEEGAGDGDQGKGGDAGPGDSGAGSGEASGDGGGDSGKGGGEGGDQSKTEFPESWRELMASGDEKLAKALARFQSPVAVAKAFADTRAKLSSGEYKRALPEDASEEETVAWRKENGIPETHEGYEVTLPEDASLDPQDVPFFDSFKEFAHKNNLDNNAVNAAINWYSTFAEEQAAQIAAQDLQDKEAGIDSLREEWGPEYKANRVAAKGLFGEMADSILGARTPEGKLIGNMPEFLKWAAGVALEINPAATLVSGVGNTPEAVKDEMAKLEKLMGDKNSEYWKGPKAEENQARYLKLIEAQERLNKG